MKSLIIFLLLSLIPNVTFGHGGEDFDFSKLETLKNDRDVFVTIDKDAINFSIKEIGLDKVTLLEKRDGLGLVKIKESMLPYLSHLMHEEFKRCGGFMRHFSEEEANNEMLSFSERLFAEKAIFADYSINQAALVKRLVPMVQEKNIEAVIRKLSSFKNRYYKSHGVDSSKWLINYWNKIAASRSDAKAYEWKHQRWAQPSAILEIKGTTDEVIIIGGHADSISGYFGRENARAPGADDNASGIATLTEVMRILIGTGYKPQKTIMFMGYAAEEVGLLGSKEIAQKFKADGRKVVGVLQLDMTNFKGTSELDIVMMTDYTNKDQNAFLGKLIDRYIPGVKWGYDKCGYACSDHASWHSAGFPASIPFESKTRQMNRKIHTKNDTIEQSRGNAHHASKFAKLALSYVIELDR